MNKPSGNTLNKKGGHQVLEASIAGAGGGTLVLLIADSIPENWIIKPIVKYIAPTVGIFLTSFWIWVKKRFSEYNKNKKRGLVLIEIERFMNDPITSQNHKDLLRQKLEQIQLDIVANRISDVENL